MRRIAILNQKGGVGKTVTSVNLSASLADLGYRVCLIDLDPQSHASLHLGREPSHDQPSIYDVVVHGAELQRAKCDVFAGLSLVPSHLDLAAAELELAGVVGREFVLRDALENLDSDLDFVITDCPPSLGILTLNALAAMDEILVPMQPHFLALHGLSKLMDTVDVVSRRLNPKLTLAGVVLCLYESGTRLAAEIRSDVEKFFQDPKRSRSPWQQARLFSTVIRKNIRLAEAPSFGQTIFQYAPSCHGAEDYRQLALELAGISRPAKKSPAKPAQILANSRS